uniref:Uncharacterized protein n=1 Tax=Anopheles atroparvus TaxID=41427 RepID=A0A182JHG7_ANOAO
MVHLQQATRAERLTPPGKAGLSFMDSFKGMFSRRHSKLATGASGLQSSPAVPLESRLSPKAPIASPESGSEPSSLVLPPSSAGQHRTVTIHLPDHGDNRYAIRRKSRRERPDEREPRPVEPKKRTGHARSVVKSVKRRSFGKRINNLWSNFGLLRSSERIVEFANGHVVTQLSYQKT